MKKESEADQMRLRDTVKQLRQPERAVIVLRFGLDGQRERTEKETAELLGLSQAQVSRRLKNAVVQMRKYGIL